MNDSASIDSECHHIRALLWQKHETEIEFSCMLEWNTGHSKILPPTCLHPDIWRHTHNFSFQIRLVHLWKLEKVWTVTADTSWNEILQDTSKTNHPPTQLLYLHTKHTCYTFKLCSLVVKDYEYCSISEIMCPLPLHLQGQMSGVIWGTRFSTFILASWEF